MKMRSFFTLVELLIVIGIIIILAGILLPVTSSALKKADQTKALAQAKTLENAIKMFKNDYGYYPGTYNTNGMLTSAYSDFIKILQGEEDTVTYNTRKTRYLEIQGNEKGQYKDPWDGEFKVWVDHDNNGKIVISGGLSGVRMKKSDTTDTTDFYYSVIVYSEGLDAAKTTDNIYSFPTVLQKGDDGKKVHLISK